MPMNGNGMRERRSGAIVRISSAALVPAANTPGADTAPAEFRSAIFDKAFFDGAFIFERKSEGILNHG